MTATFLAACIGALVEGAGPWHWVITYADAIADETTTLEPKFCDLRASQRFTYHVCNAVACSNESGELCSDQLPGDTNCDGAVGTPDFILLRNNFGRVAP